MNSTIPISISVCLIGLGLSAVRTTAADDSFCNMGFESARKKPIIYDYVSAGDALPWWMCFYGTHWETGIWWESPGDSGPCISTLGTNSPAGPGYTAIEGKFSVLLQGGNDRDVSITQSGDVPTDAQSLRFKARPGRGMLDLSLGGVSVPFFALSTESNYTEYGADVSKFAGQNLELRFSTLSISAYPGLNNWVLDSINFSAEAVPEPGAFWLWLLFVCLWCLPNRLIRHGEGGP